MDERLERLERRVEELVARVEALEQRLTEGVGVPRTAEPLPGRAHGAARPTGAPGAAEISFLLGRSLLILGGAYLLRAFTEGGTLPPRVGLVLGLAYGLLWLLLAAGSGRSGRRLGAAFLGVTAVTIAYPLIWETTTRFRLLAPVPAAALIAGVTTGALVIGSRFGLRTTAWSATLAGIGTAFALLVQTHVPLWFSSALLLIGLEAAAVAYVTRWHLLRWPAAFMADLVVAQVVAWAAAPGGPPEAYAALSRPATIALALGLFFGYVALAAGRAMYRSRDLSGFETAQCVAAFAVGFLGAARVCARTGGSCWWLAVLGLGLAVLSYVLAFAYVDRLEGRSRAYYFFLVTGFGLFVAGTWLLLPRTPRVLVWFVASAAAALTAVRFRRMALAVQSAALVPLAAWAGGALTFLSHALLESPRLPPWIGGVSVGALLLLYILLHRFEPERGGVVGRWPHLLTAAFATLCAAGAAVTAVALGASLDEPGELAALRTVVLSVSAVILAVLAARFPRARELSWLSSLLLVVIGCKLVLVDLKVGTTAALVASFVGYGLALLVAPRIGRREKR